MRSQEHPQHGSECPPLDVGQGDHAASLAGTLPADDQGIALAAAWIKRWGMTARIRSNHGNALDGALSCLAVLLHRSCVLGQDPF